MPDALPVDDHDPGADGEPEADEVAELSESIECELQRRLWVRAAAELLRAAAVKTDRSERVQWAVDRAVIAACERLVRLFGSDLPADLPPDSG
jgi:hypothetical protein